MPYTADMKKVLLLLAAAALGQAAQINETYHLAAAQVTVQTYNTTEPFGQLEHKLVVFVIPFHNPNADYVVMMLLTLSDGEKVRITDPILNSGTTITWRRSFGDKEVASIDSLVLLPLIPDTPIFVRP